MNTASVPRAAAGDDVHEGCEVSTRKNDALVTISGFLSMQTIQDNAQFSQWLGSTLEAHSNAHYVDRRCLARPYLSS